MLEVLVTLFIITLFVLASAGVQSSAIRLNKAAQYRTEAVLLATEIGERIEANMKEATNGTAYTCNPCSTSTIPSTQCVNATSPCDSTDLATFDLQEWGKRVGDTLPGAFAKIVYDGGAVPPTYTITLCWTDRRTNVAYSSTAATDPSGDCPDAPTGTETFKYKMTKTVFFDPG